MTTRRLSTVDAFVITDLDDAPLSVGIVRQAPKLLVEGAGWLARSQTYQFASFERQVGGASAGINAPAEARAEAIAAFVAEFTPDSGTVLLDAGKGLGPGEIGALRAADPRPAAAVEEAARLRRAGIVAATELALGGLDGRAIAIEGVDTAGPELAAALVAGGARIVAVSTASGTALSESGFDPTQLAEALGAHRADCVKELGVEARPGWAVHGAAADALLVGSKPGALDHNGAAHVKATAVVPTASLPVTAKALANLGRRGVAVLPDFIVTAGPLAAWPSSGDAPTSVSDAAAGALVTAALSEVLGSPQGALLAACERAESFLRTWRSELPFGRPIA
ncbi:MAG: hypothetical protein KGR18_09315 [Acidobacteria bacterium]|nr:hypothetical protein [Acidobacteriota bacterium]